MVLCCHYLSCLFVFVFVTPEGFTTMVANEGLEKARTLGLMALHPLCE